MKDRTQYDKMTKTPVAKLIVMLSIPTILSMLVTNIYNLVDTAFVGTLGTSASGAVGIVFGFMAILQAIGFMFGQGSGSIISRMLGAGEDQKASKVASISFFSAIGLAILVSIVCMLRLHDVVMLLGSTDTIAPYAEKYVFFILIAAPFMTSSFTLNNILRYEGRAALGMIGLMTGGVLNICGDAIFMFGFKMGITGAGLSTAISQFISFSILLSMFLRKKTQCRISFKYFSADYRILLDVMSTGFPSLLRQSLNSFTTVLLNAQAAFYGDEAVAAMSIVSRVIFFTFSIAIGVGQGFQPVSGFNFGAKKYGRLRRAYKYTFIISEILLIILGSVIFVLAPDIMQLFRDDLEVVRIGVRALRLQSVAQLVLPACMVTEMLFQTTGNRLGATLLSGSRNGLFFIPALLIMAKLRGLSGIQEAQPLAFIISVVPSVIMAKLFFEKLPREDE